MRLRRRISIKPPKPQPNSDKVKGSGTVMAPNSPAVSPLMPSVK